MRNKMKRLLLLSDDQRFAGRDPVWFDHDHAVVECNNGALHP